MAETNAGQGLGCLTCKRGHLMGLTIPCNVAIWQVCVTKVLIKSEFLGQENGNPGHAKGCLYGGGDQTEWLFCNRMPSSVDRLITMGLQKIGCISSEEGLRGGTAGSGDRQRSC